VKKFFETQLGHWNSILIMQLPPRENVWKVDRTTNTTTLVSSTTASIEHVVQAQAVPLRSLFPPDLMHPAHKTKESGVVYKLYNEDLATLVLNGIEQVYAQISHRIQQSHVTTDEFKKQDKAERSELARTVYRPETRFVQLTPVRAPLSTLLNPSSVLNAQPKLVYHQVDTVPNSVIAYVQPLIWIL
jgi:hypothetical protein